MTGADQMTLKPLIGASADCRMWFQAGGRGYSGTSPELAPATVGAQLRGDGHCCHRPIPALRSSKLHDPAGRGKLLTVLMAVRVLEAVETGARAPVATGHGGSRARQQSGGLELQFLHWRFNTENFESFPAICLRSVLVLAVCCTCTPSLSARTTSSIWISTATMGLTI